jgi:hypothetical protein
MKTSRERFMAFAALGLITFTLCALMYFIYYDSNMKSLTNLRTRLSTDLRAAEDSLDTIHSGQERLEKAQTLSLPADIANPIDVKRVKGEYNDLLINLLSASHFPAAKTQLTPKAQEKAPTGLNAKRPPLNHLQFDVQVKGDEMMLVDFLHRFYATPILHRIKSLNVVRPLTRTGDQLAGELEISMSVEAVIIEGAKNRNELLPKDVKVADLAAPSARSDSNYESIASNNIFYGFEPPVQSEPLRDTFDYLGAIILDSITIDDKGVMATFFDAANNVQYVLRKRFDGTFRVDSYWYINEKQKKVRLDIGETKLSFKDPKDTDASGNKTVPYAVFTPVRVDPTGVVLEADGAYYYLHVGYYVRNVRPLKSDELKTLGLTGQSDKKNDKVKSTSSGTDGKRISTGKDEGR